MFHPIWPSKIPFNIHRHLQTSGSQVPKSYTEMFEFNATVMGFGRHRWLGEVNRSFNDIVTNAANRGRLQEETEATRFEQRALTSRDVHWAASLFFPEISHIFIGCD